MRATQHPTGTRIRVLPAYDLPAYDLPVRDGLALHQPGTAGARSRANTVTSSSITTAEAS